MLSRDPEEAKGAPHHYVNKGPAFRLFKEHRPGRSALHRCNNRKTGIHHAGVNSCPGSDNYSEGILGYVISKSVRNFIPSYAPYFLRNLYKYCGDSKPKYALSNQYDPSCQGSAEFLGFVLHRDDGEIKSGQCEIRMWPFRKHLPDARLPSYCRLNTHVYESSTSVYGVSLASCTRKADQIAAACKSPADHSYYVSYDLSSELPFNSRGAKQVLPGTTRYNPGCSIRVDQCPKNNDTPKGILFRSPHENDHNSKENCDRRAQIVANACGAPTGSWVRTVFTERYRMHQPVYSK